MWRCWKQIRPKSLQHNLFKGLAWVFKTVVVELAHNFELGFGQFDLVLRGRLRFHTGSQSAGRQFTIPALRRNCVRTAVNRKSPTSNSTGSQVWSASHQTVSPVWKVRTVGSSRSEPLRGAIIVILLRFTVRLLLGIAVRLYHTPPVKPDVRYLPSRSGTAASAI